VTEGNIFKFLLRYCIVGSDIPPDTIFPANHLTANMRFTSSQTVTKLQHKETWTTVRCDN